LYLAYAPEALRTRENVPTRSARTRTAETPPAPPDERELGLIRRRGYAENMGGWIDGLAVFAAPVFMHARLVGTIAVGVPSPHLARVDKKLVIEHVIRAGARVGARMEGRDI
jgi:DNA-binding IclR family transcriptional regulator